METRITWFDRIMAAATFAEANEQETGIKLVAGTGRKSEKTPHCKECDAVLVTDLQGVKAH